MEFSKKILLWTFIIALVIIGYAMWIQYVVITRDFHGGTEIVTALIVALGTEVTAGTSFYFWKARLENKIKLEATYGKEVVEEAKNNLNEEDY